MAQETFAQETFASAAFDAATSVPAGAPQRVAEEDYRSFSDALKASDRGRAFLSEYARRNRHADTEIVLAALARLQDAARAHQAAPEAERIRQDLRALLGTLRSARPQIDNSPGAIKAATLAALIDFTQARLEALVAPERAPLAEVPAPEQPELPIPHPAPAPTVLALVQAAMAAPAPNEPAAVQIAPPIEAKSGPGARDILDESISAFRPETVAPRPSAKAPPHNIPEVSFGDAALPASNKPEARAETPKPAPVAPPAAELIAKPQPSMTSNVSQPAAPAAKPAAAPKPAAEPYELWLDPGLAEPAPAPVTVTDASETELTADVFADEPETNSSETPAAVAAAEPPKPTTAIAALAASFERFPLAAPSAAEPASAVATLPPAPTVTAAQPAAKPAQGADPLAPLMALSVYERLALFT